MVRRLLRRTRRSFGRSGGYCHVRRYMTLWEQLPYAATVLFLLSVALVPLTCVKSCRRVEQDQARVKSDGQTHEVKSQSWRSVHEDREEEPPAPRRSWRESDDQPSEPTHTDAASAPRTRRAENDIPEPATSSLLTAGCLWLLARRRKRRRNSARQ